MNVSNFTITAMRTSLLLGPNAVRQVRVVKWRKPQVLLQLGSSTEEYESHLSFLLFGRAPSSSTAVQRGKSCILSIRYGKAFTNSTSNSFALSPCLVWKNSTGSILQSFFFSLAEPPLPLYYWATLVYLEQPIR
jgi:hypothetical protein